MPECNYCDASFEDEGAYHTHLESEHYDELGPVDRRRIGDKDDNEDGGQLSGPVILGGILVFAVGLLGVVMFISSGETSPSDMQVQQEPSELESVHYHGTMTMAVDGQQVDFSQSEYQLQADAFHFESGEGTRWHVHAKEVTLEYAMATLGINITESTVTYQGTTYRDSDSNSTVNISVNGNSVTPRDYVLQEGDQIRIDVES